MLTELLRTISSSLQAPVIALLIALVVVIIVIVGMLIAEVFTERTQFKVSLPHLVEELRSQPDTAAVIESSGLLRRQKDILLEILSHPHVEESVRESMTVSLVSGEQTRLDNRVKITDLIAKIAPMLGLMGTLIPLGPGLIAIGQGDTELLSQSLLIAFDTTVLGLIVAAVALLVSTIRKSWYVKYMSVFESAAECVLEKAKTVSLNRAPVYTDSGNPINKVKAGVER